MPGRLTGDGASRAIVAGDVALGAGWGGTATVAVTTGSTDQRGQLVVTASATTPAQATSTVTLTFAQAWEAAPFAFVVEAANTQVATGENVIDIVTTTTTLVFKHGVLPVAAKVYTFNYLCI